MTHGSRMYASLATVKFNATPPAFSDMSNTRTDGSSRKCFNASSRDWTFIPPWMIRTPSPKSCKHGSECSRQRTRSNMLTNLVLEESHEQDIDDDNSSNQTIDYAHAHTHTHTHRNLLAEHQSFASRSLLSHLNQLHCERLDLRACGEFRKIDAIED